ncbi:hypothetical protein RchiOBHm_Chr1g0337401 [Rosa chinensis]|uniref:Uncharacterized protein n=1 Tax=Rosa chinensis TaxID=74649 RepID=A0A2P6SCX7_ROSCH|nr:hypothetical protein RchiOBHm_Chr1g0337401 [Rosa chinensis]
MRWQLSKDKEQVHFLLHGIVLFGSRGDIFLFSYGHRTNFLCFLYLSWCYDRWPLAYRYMVEEK